MIEEPENRVEQGEPAEAADQSSPGPSSSDPVKSPGLYLSDAREQRGLNRAKVGEKLGLTETAVRDLEQNQFDRFPSSVYVRGYLKNYTKILGEEESDLIELYDQYCLEHNLNAGRSTMNPTPKKTGLGKTAKMLFGLAAVVVAVGIYAVFRYFA